MTLDKRPLCVGQSRHSPRSVPLRRVKCGICGQDWVYAKGRCYLCWRYQRRHKEHADRIVSVSDKRLARRHALVDAILEVTAAKPQVKA